MIKKNVSLLSVVFLFFFAGSAFASSTGHSPEHVTSHGAVAAPPQMTLGEQLVDGIQATAGITDVRSTMAQANQSMTHHLQIFFTELSTDKLVASGIVAVRVTPPTGAEEKAKQLIGMDGHFGVDLTLDVPGLYRFAIGTKLVDGKKRQFVFEYTLP